MLASVRPAGVAAAPQRVPRAGTSTTKPVAAREQKVDGTGSFDPARLGTGRFILI
jgi:hypothetical protein